MYGWRHEGSRYDKAGVFCGEIGHPILAQRAASWNTAMSVSDCRRLASVSPVMFPRCYSSIPLILTCAWQQVPRCTITPGNSTRPTAPHSTPLHPTRSHPTPPYPTTPHRAPASPAMQALEALAPAGVWDAAASLAEGRALAEALVGHHWVAGAALGSAALQARALAGLAVTPSDGSNLRLRISGM